MQVRTEPMDHPEHPEKVRLPKQVRYGLVNLEKLSFHEKLCWPHIAIEGVLARQKCAEKWCAFLWAPGLQFSVSRNSQIFNFQDFR